MKIKLKITSLNHPDPSFPPPKEEEDFDLEFYVDSAKVRMSHGENSQVLDKPTVEFEIEDVEADVFEKYYLLEWANCYWKKDKFHGRRLRKVALTFIDDEDRDYRYFEIESAFLANFEELCSITGQDAHKNSSYKAIIRSNSKEQAIKFLPNNPDSDKTTSQT